MKWGWRNGNANERCWDYELSVKEIGIVNRLWECVNRMWRGCVKGVKGVGILQF